MKQLLTLISLLISPLILAAELSITKPDAWVKPNAIPTESFQPFGTEFRASTLLIDRQIFSHQGDDATYVRYINGVNNENGLKDIGKIELDFQPEYEKLKIHAVVIHRDNKQIDVLKDHEFEIIRQERELQNQLYSGTKTALLVIKDLRVGDFLELAYTRTGKNPIFSDHFFGQYQMSWSIPIKHNYLRVNVEPSRNLQIKNHRHDYTYKTSTENGIKSYVWEQNNVPAEDIQDQTPLWYLPYGMIELSEFSSWKGVSEWASQVFKVDPEFNSELTDLVHTWSKLPTKMEQASAATQFVQNQIRYFGIEIGINSHQPRTPLDTFESKFGDCKDKTILLHSILNKLNIASVPVLVSTERQEGLLKLLPSPGVFNHVILKINHQGTTYWVDPTINNQGSLLTHIGEANYGVGLATATGAELETMDFVHPETEQKQIKETFTVVDKDITTLSVNSEHQGFNAEDMRRVLNDISHAELKKNFESFVSKLYGFAKIHNDLNFQDNQELNLITQNENYDIKDMWQESGKHVFADFVAWAISNIIDTPTRVIRDTPLALAYPVNIKHEINIRANTAVPKVEVKDLEVTSKYLHFKRSIFRNKGNIQISFELKTREKHVPVEDVNQHIKNIKKIKDALYFRAFLALAYEEKMLEKEDELKNMLQNMIKNKSGEKG
ncbi:DUF3857 domain-containing protein [Marinicella rhabdoformis]|uniref:DUF3857 domain-containing protein n=1 Tax=Marinicella rhabdoformis TaxID=2580566 RepID=UPI0012AECCCA|nr:DUF3857 domain-containing protein [Marinicella rhabdoformis]